MPACKLSRWFTNNRLISRMYCGLFSLLIWRHIRVTKAGKGGFTCGCRSWSFKHSALRRLCPNPLLRTWLRFNYYYPWNSSLEDPKKVFLKRYHNASLRKIHYIFCILHLARNYCKVKKSQRSLWEQRRWVTAQAEWVEKTVAVCREKIPIRVGGLSGIPGGKDNCILYTNKHIC